MWIFKQRWSGRRWVCTVPDASQVVALAEVDRADSGNYSILCWTLDMKLDMCMSRWKQGLPVCTPCWSPPPSLNHFQILLLFKRPLSKKYQDHDWVFIELCWANACVKVQVYRDVSDTSTQAGWCANVAKPQGPQPKSPTLIMPLLLLMLQGHTSFWRHSQPHTFKWFTFEVCNNCVLKDINYCELMRSTERLEKLWFVFLPVKIQHTDFLFTYYFFKIHLLIYLFIY